MPAIPEIPAQDFFLGAASTGLLLWLLVYIVRRRDLDPLWHGERSLRGGPLTHLPSRAERRHLALLASLFLHLFLIAGAPLLRPIFPYPLPLNLRRYDLVVVQFERREPLRLPADLRLPPPETERAPASRDRGQAAPEPRAKAAAAGKREALKPRRPLERMAIVFPTPQPPRRAAVLDTVQAELKIPVLEPDAMPAVLLRPWVSSLTDIASIPNPATRTWEASSDSGVAVASVHGGVHEGLSGREEYGDGPVPRELHGVIVVGSSPLALPAAEGALSGNPVYTVYLDAPGFEKKWVLQVSAPLDRSQSLIREGHVIRVPPRKKLDPPYAFHKEPIPLSLDDLSGLALPSYLVVYGKFDPTGRLGELRVLSGVSAAIDQMVLAQLQKWEFAPAFRNGEPIAVEAIFGIPLH